MLKEAVPRAEDIRDYNIGESDYSKHKIQPWDIWIEYKLNPFDADIIKRILRHKKRTAEKWIMKKLYTSVKKESDRLILVKINGRNKMTPNEYQKKAHETSAYSVGFFVGEEEVSEKIKIRENYGEWKEPLVEVKE